MKKLITITEMAKFTKEDWDRMLAHTLRNPRRLGFPKIQTKHRPNHWLDDFKREMTNDQQGTDVT